MREQEKENGITLIALVVTIVVLIIIAGVSISTLMGDSGIIEYAKRAEKETEESAKREKNDLEELESELTGKKYGVEANIQLSGEKLQVETPVLQAQIKHVSYSNTEIDIAKCAWALTSDSKPLGEEKEKYANSFKENEEEISFELPQAGDYYLHVLTVDNQEHIKETISDKISVSEKYHKHEGNNITGGACYTQPVRHAHAGNSTTGGGCYTRPVYHTHTGNEATGSGCYNLPIVHTHQSSCYETKNVTKTCEVTSTSKTYSYDTTYMEHLRKCGTCNGYSKCSTTITTYTHTGCGAGQTTYESYRCSVHGSLGSAGSKAESHNYTTQETSIVCGKQDGQIERYQLNCGKIEGQTIERYELGCGKNEQTIEYYNLTCDKSESIREGYEITY